MDSDTLQALTGALKASPDNLLLRVQVVRGTLRLRRWEQARELAEPLLGTEHRPLALLALARDSLRSGRLEEARNHYQAAIREDRSLLDEGLEAELEPEQTLRLPAGDGSPEDSSVPRTSFADIGGMEPLKEQIRLNILYPLQRPEIYQAYGKKIGGGILLYGPPGCGKTHLARATAGEIGAHFYVLSLNEVLSMWVGETEKNLTDLFETARANAPAILFIDEVDALGSKRSNIESTSVRWMVSQLLTEMDGIQSGNQKLLVLGATNAPWDVDSALRRPGRFDRVLFVPPPDAAARQEILKLHARNRKIDPALVWSKVVARTELFSGADLAHLVDRATERALSDALQSGKLREVTVQDFERSVQGLRPSTAEWLRRARNYVTFSNQDGLYDELARYLEKHRSR